MNPYVLVRFDDDTFGLFRKVPGNVEGAFSYKPVVMASGEMHSLSVLQGKVQQMMDVVNGTEIVDCVRIQSTVEQATSTWTD